jgi:hypothetical protein
VSNSVGLALVAGVCLSVFLLRWLFSRKGPVWLGALVPCLWLVAVAVAVTQGRVDTGRQYLVAAMGLGMFLWVWAGGRQARAKTIKGA